VSDTHKVAAKGKYLAMVSTTVETPNPEEELKPALNLLGEIDEKFVFVTDLFEANDAGLDSKVCMITYIIALGYIGTIFNPHNITP
jgi:Rab GDP dissociation inhibitor